MKSAPLVKLILTLCFQVSLLAQTDPDVVNVINTVNIDSLAKYVEELSGVDTVYIDGNQTTINSRNRYKIGNADAANYLAQKLSSYGLATNIDSYSVYGNNVIAVQTGSEFPDEKYIICAHFDDMPSSDIAPGADDNASGTAAVIEAARILSQFTSKYTIVYALWDEEEYGLIGSDNYAVAASNNNENILGVINIDMIGWDSNDDGLCDIHTRNIANSLEISDSMVSVNSNYNIGLNPVIRNPGTGASDHSSFWDQGYGAVLLIEAYYGGDFNNFYHSANDQIIHFNMGFFEKCSKLAIGTLALFADIDSGVPVELISFDASITNNEIILYWQTATETNSSSFEIQRSADNIYWETIGDTPANNTVSEISSYNFTDKYPLKGISYYRLIQYDLDGSAEIFEPLQVDFTPVSDYVLKQNYPNPFNPSTVIEFSIPESGFVSLKVFNILGKEVATLLNKKLNAGLHHAEFDTESISGLSSGVYFYKLESGSFVDVKKMIVSK